MHIYTVQNRPWLPQNPFDNLLIEKVCIIIITLYNCKLLFYSEMSNSILQTHLHCFKKVTLKNARSIEMEERFRLSFPSL
jgi:hypothetical protein